MTPNTQLVYLGLGSNLGNRAENLRLAHQWLEVHKIKIVRASHLYQTEPVDYTDQPWFLNQVLEVQTLYPPHTLLDICLAIEKRLGRKRTLEKGPRTIDLDILFFGNSVLVSTSLTIPHPRHHLRRFVLTSLFELDPHFRHPALNQTIADLLRHCGDTASVELWPRIC
jgi:2-amino-4-hydroxy-6-hydroxymethyldihydropteridine diphosphokinase